MTQGRRLTELTVGDDPSVWASAGFTVYGESIDVGGVRIRLVGSSGGDGILSWGFDPPWRAPIDGLDTVSPASDGPRERQDAGHPNGVSALDHVVVYTSDVERTTAELAQVGLVPRRTVVGARGDADVLYRFFLLHTSLLELIGPATPSVDGPARFAGLAFTTARIDDLGEVAGRPRDAIQPGRRIATLRREIGSSVPIAFLTPRR